MYDMSNAMYDFALTDENECGQILTDGSIESGRRTR
jgi:hypothetical protein